MTIELSSITTRFEVPVLFDQRVVYVAPGGKTRKEPLEGAECDSDPVPTAIFRDAILSIPKSIKLFSANNIEGIVTAVPPATPCTVTFKWFSLVKENNATRIIIVY